MVMRHTISNRAECRWRPEGTLRSPSSLSLAWSPHVQRGWLCIESQGSACLCLLATGITSIHHQDRQFLKQMLVGDRTQVLVIERQALYCLSHLSAVAFMPLNCMFLPVFHWDDLCPELLSILQSCLLLPACLGSS